MESSMVHGGVGARSGANSLANVALGLAIAAFVAWALADVVDDALYPVNGVLSLGALATGIPARARARRGAGHGRRALVAIVLGGLFVLANVGFGIAELVD